MNTFTEDEVKILRAIIAERQALMAGEAEKVSLEAQQLAAREKQIRAQKEKEIEAEMAKFRMWGPNMERWFKQ